MDYLYLHGFASGPQSAKAQFLRHQFEAVGQTFHILDLNQGDFGQLTLSRQIQQSLNWLRGRPSVGIIGSSLGGLTAAWIAQQPSALGRVAKLVLLAPAFQFLDQWLPRLGAATVTHWQEVGELWVYHYGYGQQQPLSYQFVEDAQHYQDADLTVAIPTLILHGRFDEVIDIQVSRDYADSRPWVELVALDADHSLQNVHAQIWEAVAGFLGISAPG